MGEDPNSEEKLKLELALQRAMYRTEPLYYLIDNRLDDGEVIIIKARRGVRLEEAPFPGYFFPEHFLCNELTLSLIMDDTPDSLEGRPFKPLEDWYKN